MIILLALKEWMNLDLVMIAAQAEAPAVVAHGTFFSSHISGIKASYLHFQYFPSPSCDLSYQMNSLGL